jgi:hypothetical protein
VKLQRQEKARLLHKVPIVSEKLSCG